VDITKFEKLIDLIADILLDSFEGEGLTIQHIELLKVLNDMVRTYKEICEKKRNFTPTEIIEIGKMMDEEDKK